MCEKLKLAHDKKTLVGYDPVGYHPAGFNQYYRSEIAWDTWHAYENMARQNALVGKPYEEYAALALKWKCLFETV